VILLKDYKKLDGPPAKVTRYVETVVQHLILNHGGLARLKCASDADVDEQVAVAPDPEQAVRRAELWHKMKGYVGRLSKEEAEVFEARELHGMIFEVIAAALDRPLGTVVSQHARAIEKLRDMARASERPAAPRASLPEKARGPRR
jgi:RNA polymerase sigma factor (sigma-70 family)